MVSGRPSSATALRACWPRADARSAPGAGGERAMTTPRGSKPGIASGADHGARSAPAPAAQRGIGQAGQSDGSEREEDLLLATIARGAMPRCASPSAPTRVTLHQPAAVEPSCGRVLEAPIRSADVRSSCTSWMLCMRRSRGPLLSSAPRRRRRPEGAPDEPHPRRIASTRSRASSAACCWTNAALPKGSKS